MAFHLKDFVSQVGQAGLEAELRHLPHFPSGLNSCLLFGPESSGKTAMLFHFAIRVAEAGRMVLFVCRHSKAEELPPPLPQGVSAKDVLLANIHIKYVDSNADLLKLGTCLHLLPFIPEAVIVDDFRAICSPVDQISKDAEIMKILAFLRDGVDHFRRAGKQCRLLISDVGADSPASQFLYEHWLPLILRIKRTEEGLVLGPIAPAEAAWSMPSLQCTLHAHCGVLLQRIDPPFTAS